MKTRPLPSQERLQYLFYYSPKFGKLYARFKASQHPIGRHGSLENNGYLQTKVDGVIYKTHRLIWVYVHGDIPEGKQIDHINGNRADNKLENLRLVSPQENDHNRTKAKGYCFHKASGKYNAKIQVDGKQKHLGLFDCPLLARLAYLDAKDIYHPTHCLK